MPQPFMTPMGAEILFLLNGTLRSLPELFSLLRYEAGDIRRCIRDLSQKWLINLVDERVTLTFTGHILANKIRAALPAQYGREISLVGECPSGNQSDWVLDPEAREKAFRDLFQSNPWLELLPDQPLLPDDGTGQWKTGISMGSWSTSCPGEGDTPLDDLFRTSVVIQNFGLFLMIHTIEALPSELAERLGDLYQARLVSEIPVDFKQNFDFYLDIIRQAEKIRGVSTWATPGIAFEMGKRILHGADVELIITPELAETLLSAPYRQIALNLIGLSNLRFRISQVPVEAGLTVTDRHLSLGLFIKKGHQYNKYYDLISTAPRALAWGWDLYRYYQQNSLPADEFFARING